MCIYMHPMQCIAKIAGKEPATNCVLGGDLDGFVNLPSNALQAALQTSAELPY